MKTPIHQHNVVSNLVYYTSPPKGTRIRRLALPDVYGPEFRTSAISIVKYPYANVRYVNYWIQENGDYKMPRNDPVITHNAYMNIETGKEVQPMDEASVSLPRIPNYRIQGLEDIRVTGDTFTATVADYHPNIRILYGTYRPGRYEDCRVMDSPFDKDCEKNWLRVPETPDILYDWHPLQIGQINRKKLDIRKKIETPPLFSLFRGSAPPVRVGIEWWVLVHFVEYCKPRKYYHAMVVLNDEYKPARVSLPFVFASSGIEYCVSFRMSDPDMVFYVSFMDRDSSEVKIPRSSLEWVTCT
jgi:hypothetical protein